MTQTPGEGDDAVVVSGALGDEDGLGVDGHELVRDVGGDGGSVGEDAGDDELGGQDLHDGLGSLVHVPVAGDDGSGGVVGLELDLHRHVRRHDHRRRRPSSGP